MKKSLVNYYFPIEMRYASVITFVVSIYLLFYLHFLFAFVLILAGLVILTAKYVTTIDEGKKSIHDYFFMLGLRFKNETVSYGLLKQIIITKENKGYSANSRSRERQVKWSQYNAFLLYDNEKSLKLLSENSLKALINNLENIIESFNIKVEDRTTNFRA